MELFSVELLKTLVDATEDTLESADDDDVDVSDDPFLSEQPQRTNASTAAIITLYFLIIVSFLYNYHLKATPAKADPARVALTNNIFLRILP